MPAIVLVGAQWGDEGKGKAQTSSVSVSTTSCATRGNNAGHTVVIGDEKYALHLLPSGILTPSCVPVIANGVVIDPTVLEREMKGLQARGISTDRLVISSNAHIIAPYHVELDKVTERFAGKKKIGTTGRGIGPAYGDKIARIGIRVQDLFDEEGLRDKVAGALYHRNQVLLKIFNRRAIDVDLVCEQLLSFAPCSLNMSRTPAYCSTTPRTRASTFCWRVAGHAAGRRPRDLPVRHIVESHGRRCVRGSGIGPTRISRVLGILKAYTTRVGAGPFPTELFDDDGERLRSVGGEVGVTTGRDRRCGWFDGPIARNASRINGLTDIFLTKLDVLSGWDRIPVCVATKSTVSALTTSP